jgi:hypothetical protein
MGIATPLKHLKGNRRKISHILASAGFLLATSISMVLSQASPTYAAATYDWVNDATINGKNEPIGWAQDKTRNYTAVYKDSNPYDTVREFRDTTTKYYCKNNVVDSIFMQTPTSGTLTYVTSAPGLDQTVDGTLMDCTTATKIVSIGSLENAQTDSSPCPAAGNAEIKCLEARAKGNKEWARLCFYVGTPGAPTPPAGDFCSVANAPGTGAGGGTTDDTTDDTKAPDPCDSLGDFSLRWLTCPILTAGVAFTDAADTLIEDQLHYGTQVFDTTTAAGKNFKAAWNSFRIVGLSLLLIVGLIMVVGQAADLQIFDAYAFRKTLPRLLIAVIAIALSWQILEFVVVFFNDLGHWVQDLILAPFFSNEADPTSSNPFAAGSGIALVVSGALLGTGAAALTLGPLGIISLIVTVILSIFIGLFVLMTRSAILTIAIITAPMAIACWVLPNTRKVWDFWQNGTSTALVIFPVIMMFIAAGKAMSLVTGNGLMKVLFLVFPYLLLPLAFRLVGGLMQTLFSLTNDRSRGAFDRLSNFRRGQVKSRMEDAVQGTGKTWLSKDTGIGRVGRPLGSVYRRGRMANEYGIRGIGGATYTAGLQKLRDKVGNEALKDDNGRAAGDDDANALALQSGMNSREFVRRYARQQIAARNQARKTDPSLAIMSQQDAESRAQAALRTLETGYGAKMGSEAMRVTAFRARGTSGTGYDASGNYQQPTEDAASLVADGLITTQDAAVVFKANQKRGELNAIGFGNHMANIDRAVGRYRTGARGAALVTADESRALRREALNGVMPGQFITGRHETVRALAPEMVETVNDTLAHVDANGNTVGTDDIALGRELAKIAGRYDAMAQSNPLNAEIMANEVMSHTLTRAAADPRFINADGTAMSVQQMIDHFRNDENFLTMRREFQSATSANAAAMANTGQPAGQGPGQMPGQMGIF